jgi:tetratricopeptide (TPR) repeat protein
MKITSTLVFLVACLQLHSQEILTSADKCYKEKNYACATENYKKAIEQKVYTSNNHATILYRIGFGLGELDKTEEAISYFKQALEIKPDMGDAYWSLAGNYYNRKEYQLASENYGKAIGFFKEKNDLKTLYYWRAKSYNALEKYNDALTNYNLAIAIDSNNANYHASIGDTYYNQKRYNDAIKSYQRSIFLRDNDKKVMAARYYWLGQAYFELSKYQDALIAYRGAIEYDPGYKNGYWGIAAVYYKQEKWPQAIEEYTKTMSYYKDDTASMKDLYYYRGRSYSFNNEVAKAIADFDALLKIDPGYRNAYWQKSSAYYRNKKYKEAIPLYTRTIELYKGENNSLDDLYFFRGNSYLQLKDTAKAREDFLKALEFNKNLLDPNVGLGDISFANRRYYEAKDYYAKGLSGYKTDSAELSKLYFRRAFAYLMTGVGTSGKSDLETSIKYDSLNKEAHRYLGEVNFTAGYYYTALNEFDKAVRLYKNVKDSLPKMYTYRGMTNSKLGKYKEALLDYEQADKLKPNSVDIIAGIGQLSFETKEYARVVSSFTKAITLYKPSQVNELAFAYYARGRGHYELKDKEKAKADFEKALSYVPNYTEAQKWLETVNRTN